MRVFLTMLVFVMPLSAAKAEELAAHCERAGQLFYRDDDLVAKNVESFPELDPPRVRMDLDDDEPPRNDGLDFLTQLNGILCRFERQGELFVLADFCGPDGCIFTSPERVEEVKVLLQREGY